MARSDAFFKGKSGASARVDSDDDFTPRSKARSDALAKGKSAAPASGSSTKGKKKKKGKRLF
jgi:hypothetical protein